MWTTGSFKSLMDGCVIRVYGGPVPTADGVHADMPLTVDNPLLVEISKDGDGSLLTFQPGAQNGVITKNLDEIWTGDVLASGTPTFFRLVKPTDDGLESTTLYRVQGTAGIGNTDLTMTSANLIAGVPVRLGYAQLIFPAQ
tara:strand:+ start:139 stop:561 length:423 start_codon:yes stop_codon:yes gene_type:complete